MQDIDLPINRSDADGPEEVTPWKEHAIESDPRWEHSREMKIDGTPQTIAVERNTEERINQAISELIEPRNDLPPEVQKAVDTA